MKLQHPPHPSINAYGKSFASFGEIAQGRLSGGEDFLVSLPIDLWSQCELICTTTNHNTVITTPTPLTKAKRLAELLVGRLGIRHGFSIQLYFERNIPIGKGLSSSTADLLAVVRAFESGFNFVLSQEAISELLIKVEQHDPLHYDKSVAYDHRRGKLLKNYDYVPSYKVIGIDQGGTLSTHVYNKTLAYSEEYLVVYDQLFHDLGEAFRQQDDRKIARCATKSAVIHARRTNNHWLNDVLSAYDNKEVLGVVTTHSGTCAGIMLPPNSSQSALKKITQQAQQYGEMFTTNTLPNTNSPDRYQSFSAVNLNRQS